MFKINKVSEIKDAFIVAYSNGTRIDIFDAITKMENQ
jgi:hypothetical protein